MLGVIAQLPPVPTSAAFSGSVILLVTVLVGLDVYRRREFVLFANLGAAPATVVMLGSLTALLLELLLICLKDLFR